LKQMNDAAPAEDNQCHNDERQRQGHDLGEGASEGIAGMVREVDNPGATVQKRNGGSVRGGQQATREGLISRTCAEVRDADERAAKSGKMKIPQQSPERFEVQMVWLARPKA
jgi:hypothetical protein